MHIFLDERDKQIIDEQLNNLETNFNELSKDIDNSREAIAELADKKITKFYANNLGETTLNDSDNGKIQDMIIYGKSTQDGTPTPDNPIEIKSVVNPVVKVCGKNLWGTIWEYGMYNETGKASNNAVLCAKDLIKVKPSTSYVLTFESLSGDTVNFPDVWLYDSNKNSLGNCKYCRSAIIVTNTKKIIRYDIPEKCEYIGMYCSSASLCLNDVTNIISTQLEKGSTATPYEPYTETTATLPYTLNAIPVSKGGNVTIDGQEYIADYVDIERKKLVRNINVKALIGTANFITENSWVSGSYTIIDFFTRGKAISGFGTVANILCKYCSTTTPTSVVGGNIGIGYGNGQQLYIYLGAEYDTKDKIVEFLNTNNFEIYYPLETPTEIVLTDEEVQVFKELATYYPTTNIMVTSEQLEGYTTFNYPLSMANGWNIIKEQLGDTRNYIYDMDLQSAEAYVNSEYAVTLTELGV